MILHYIITKQYKNTAITAKCLLSSELQPSNLSLQTSHKTLFVAWSALFDPAGSVVVAKPNMLEFHSLQ